VQSKTIINLLSNEISRHFIESHIKDNIELLALSAHKYPEIDIKAAIQLISLLQKARIKLPEHYKVLAALHTKSYEQSTSERVANFKSNFMQVSGKEVLNLSGGLGVDDHAFAKSAKNVVSCDIDFDTHQIAVYNNNLLKFKNINRVLVDGITFLKEHNKVDIIYIDPDRRPQAARVFRLEDCEPDILTHLDLLMNKTEELWLKISPMADISYLEKSLPNISKIAIIGWQEEVKEILICCKSKVNLEGIERFTIRLSSKDEQVFTGRGIESLNGYNFEGKYLYEPDKTIIKAGLSADYSDSKGLKMLGPQTHFYISNDLISDFQGRTFKIIDQLPYKPKLIKSYLQQKKIVRSDITIRNFRETTAQVRERFKLKQTGEHYLCFATDYLKQTWMYHVEPLKD